MDWDDYRFFEALVQQGSVRGAAQKLGVNPSTVTRRLEHLEQALGLTLFKRSGTGIEITTSGVDVAQRVERIAREIAQLKESVKGRDQRVAGLIRVAVPESLGSELLLPHITRFASLYEDIDLELLRAPREDLVKLKLDVDVLLQLTDHPDEAMVGRPYARPRLAVYAASQSEAEATSAAESWVEWVAPGDLGRSVVKVRQGWFADLPVRLRSESVAWVREAIAAGAGIGVLPCSVGDTASDLQRLDHIADQPGPALWVLSHPYARSVTRVQLFLAYLRDLLSEPDPRYFFVD